MMLAVTMDIIWSSMGMEYSVRMRRCSPAPAWRSTSSWRRLPMPRKRARRPMQTRSHGVMLMSRTTAPATARSTKPAASIKMSKMTMFFSQ